MPDSRQSTSYTGEIIRVNGPIVYARNMENAGMLEVVEVGELRLIGEVIRLEDGVATLQVYENTTGLRPGEPVYCTGRPLSVKLGPVCSATSTTASSVRLSESSKRPGR